MEYADLGNLFSYVRLQAFSENTTRYVFSELLKAVSYLHQNNIIHRDIKLENILFDKFFQIKLADFGFATYSSGLNNDYKHYSRKGTLNYLAPEIYNFEHCQLLGYNGEQAEVFALGVILFCMLIGRPPFLKPDPNSDELYKMIYNQQG